MKHLSINQEGRDFYFGDVHGEVSILKNALESIQFNENGKDRAISAGDLVDRGPESHKTPKLLKESWIHAVTSNHDERALIHAKKMLTGEFDLIDYLEINKMSSGWLLNCYRHQNRALLHDIVQEFSKNPFVMTIDSPKGLVGVVHAEFPVGMHINGVEQALEKAKQNGESALDKGSIIHHLLWNRERFKARNPQKDLGVPGLYRLFSGHTPQQNRCKQIGNMFDIDTGCGRGGVLTVVEGTASDKAITREITPKERVQGWRVIEADPSPQTT